MSDMSDSNAKPGMTIEIFDRIADLPHEVLWQEVANQLAKMFFDMGHEDIVKDLAKNTTCLDPGNGAIMWSGQVHPEVPSVRIEVRGPFETAELREWSCRIHYTATDLELTDVGSMQILMTSARLLAFRQFVHELNERPRVVNVQASRQDVSEPDDDGN